MPIQHACFISYPHPRVKRSDLSRFVKDFVRALEEKLDGYVSEPVYFDKDRLKPGYNYDEKLAKAICESVCMVVVYFPEYQRREYCLREFELMEKIDVKRKEVLAGAAHGVHFIVPVSIVGLTRVPERLGRDARDVADFSKYTTLRPRGRRLHRDEELHDKLLKIRDMICELRNLLHPAEAQLEQHIGLIAMPTKDSLRPWEADGQPFPC
jgi:hypothetical protein